MSDVIGTIVNAPGSMELMAHLRTGTHQAIALLVARKFLLEVDEIHKGGELRRHCSDQEAMGIIVAGLALALHSAETIPHIFEEIKELRDAESREGR